MFPVQGSSEENANANYTYPPPTPANAPPIYGLPPQIPGTTALNGFDPNFHLTTNNTTYSWPPEVTVLQNTQIVQVHTAGYGYGNPITATYGHQYWNEQQRYPVQIPNSEIPNGTWYDQLIPPPPPPGVPSYFSLPGNINAVQPVPEVSNSPAELTATGDKAEQEANLSRKTKLENDGRLPEPYDRHSQHRKKRRSSSLERRSSRRRTRSSSPDRRRRRPDHQKPDQRDAGGGKTHHRSSHLARNSPEKKDVKEKHRQSSHRRLHSREAPSSSGNSRRLQDHPSRTSERQRSPIRRHHARQRDSSRSRYNRSSDVRSSSTRIRNDSRTVEASNSKRGQQASTSSASGNRERDRRSPNNRGNREELLKFTCNDEDEFDETLKVEKWVRSAPAELYYNRDSIEMKATERTKLLCRKFETNLVERAKSARLEAEALGAAKMKELVEKEANEYGDDDSSTSDSGESSCEDDKSSRPSRSTAANRELERRKLHPKRLHLEMWHNDPGLMNDGPVCRCSAKARRFGIRHGFYPGEDIQYKCDPFSNNPSQLFHYRITITPAKNFLVNSPTVIAHDGHEYLFEGFSLFSHYELDLKLPPCKVIRFNIRYDVFVEKEPHPESFCVKELNLFETYLFREILELVDLKQDWDQETGCSQFHLMPRFVRQLPDNGKEVLSMNRVLLHLLKHDKELVREEDLPRLLQVEQKEWQNFADKHKGMLVTKWGMKPCALRVDQIDREIAFDKDGSCNSNDDGIPYPVIVHFGIRPPQLSYAGNSGYQRAWRRYVKYRHLLSNMPKPSIEEKRKLVAKDLKLRQMRTASTMKRDVTVDISSKGFRATGICCDIVQHAMLVPVLVGHLRFHKSLVTLERRLQYTFQNPYLLQLAMTHPSYRENFGTNPDHARNALTNCGIRQPEYGDRRIHYSSTRKRGINTLINIMARFGAEDETESEITHNERLEFLGDAVVEFATSIHLFHLFPDLEEGGLATYRAAIVQNQHLAELAQNLQLDQFMLYAHGSDLCHDSELRHAMANCFEALMGAIFLDGGIEVADRIFGRTLYENDAELYDIWTNYPKHPLQAQEPEGDRHWILSHGGVLKKLTEFEELIGLEFTHIRLLARAFTDRSLGYNHLSRGSNQRLEFLGDTVLQLISSEYLYRHFPDHHEGHLSLLRSSLVNNRTQSLVCDDLGMTNYAMRGDPKVELKTKDRADLLEAFLGALYIDKGLKYCVVFCSVCFIPRLSTSIIKQEWNDPKSKLQQCCLTLRTMDGNEPDIPQYKITESKGPTNTRVYVVAVFFRGERLATAEGHSIQEAEMNAAANALRESEALFPQLTHQRRIIDKTKPSRSRCFR